MLASPSLAGRDMSLYEHVSLACNICDQLYDIVTYTLTFINLFGDLNLTKFESIVYLF